MLFVYFEDNRALWI